MLNKIKSTINGIKHHIDEFVEMRNTEMEKWKEEDPDAYYEYLAMQYDEKY